MKKFEVLKRKMEGCEKKRVDLWKGKIVGRGGWWMRYGYKKIFKEVIDSVGN